MFSRAVISSIVLPVMMVSIAESRTIELNITDSIQCKDDNTYIIYEGESLKFNIVGIVLKHALCQYWSKRNLKTNSSSKNILPDGTILMANNVNTNMTTWKCVFLRDRSPDDTNIKPYYYLDRNYTAIECIRNIHVRSKTGVLKIKIQGELMDMNITDASILDYDAETIYYYQEGEYVNIDCELKNFESNVKMVYYDANGIPYFVAYISYVGDLKFRSHMYIRHNSSYLEYHYSNMELDSFVYRLYFIWMQRFKDSSIVLVNGQELVYRPGYARYLYYYIDGQQVELVCTTRKGHAISNDVIQKHLSWRYNGSNIIERCGTVDNPVDVTFTSDLYYKTPRIAGLQKNNIIYEYTSSANNDLTIHYQYWDNVILNLTCVVRLSASYNVYLQWIYRGTTIKNSGTPKVDANYKTQSINKIFLLDKSDDETAIACQAKRSTRNWRTVQNTDPSVILKLYRIRSKNATAEVSSNFLYDEIAPRPWSKYLVIFLFVIVALLILMFWFAIKRKISRRTSCSESEDIYHEIVYGAPPPLPPRRRKGSENENHYDKIDDGIFDDKGYCIMRGKTCRSETPEPPYYMKMQPFSPVLRAKSESLSMQAINYGYELSNDSIFNKSQSRVRRKTL